MNNDKHSTFDLDGLPAIEPIEVPSSDALQARILQSTLEMPQTKITDSNNSDEAKVFQFKTFPKPVIPFAIAASVALFAFLTFPGLLGTISPSTTNVAPVAVESMSVDDLSLEELDFEEAMLMHDEWVFAQL